MQSIWQPCNEPAAHRIVRISDADPIFAEYTIVGGDRVISGIFRQVKIHRSRGTLYYNWEKLDL